MLIVGCLGRSSPQLELPSEILRSPYRSDLGTILLIVLVLLLIGALPSWPYSVAWGPGRGLLMCKKVMLVLALTGLTAAVTPLTAAVDKHSGCSEAAKMRFPTDHAARKEFKH
jgi:hypothetical protein